VSHSVLFVVNFVIDVFVIRINDRRIEIITELFRIIQVSLLSTIFFCTSDFHSSKSVKVMYSCQLLFFYANISWMRCLGMYVRACTYIYIYIYIYRAYVYTTCTEQKFRDIWVFSAFFNRKFQKMELCIGQFKRNRSNWQFILLTASYNLFGCICTRFWCKSLSDCLHLCRTRRSFLMIYWLFSSKDWSRWK